MWVVENPWPPFFLLLLAAIVAAWRWRQTRRPRLLVAAGCLLPAAMLSHVVDQLVVTEAEVVEQRVHDLVAAFRVKDLPRTESFLAKNVKPEQIPTLIRSAMHFVEIHGEVSIKDMQTRMRNQNTLAVTRFRANADITYQKETKTFQPSRWELTWERQGGEWRVVRVQRLDPLSDRELPLFHPLQGESRKE